MNKCKCKLPKILYYEDETLIVIVYDGDLIKIPLVTTKIEVHNTDTIEVTNMKKRKEMLLPKDTKKEKKPFTEYTVTAKVSPNSPPQDTSTWRDRFKFDFLDEDGDWHKASPEYVMNFIEELIKKTEGEGIKTANEDYLTGIEKGRKSSRKEIIELIRGRKKNTMDSIEDKNTLAGHRSYNQALNEILKDLEKKGIESMEKEKHITPDNCTKDDVTCESIGCDYPKCIQSQDTKKG